MADAFDAFLGSSPATKSPQGKGDAFDAFLGAAPQAGPSSADVDRVRALIGTPREVIPRLDKKAMYANGMSPETAVSLLDAGDTQKPSGPPPRTRGMRDPITGEIGPTLDEGDADRAKTLSAAISRGLDSASTGLYSRGRDAVMNTIRPGSGDQLRQDEARTNADNPVGVGLGRGAGYFFGAPALAARGVSAGLGMLGRAAFGEGAAAVPALIARPVTGAVTGAAVNAPIAAAEAGAAGASPREMLSAAGTGAKQGAAWGGFLGAVGGTAETLAKGAGARQDARTIGDYTDGAPAGKRDRVVGKAGEKTPRVVELAKRYGLDSAGGDSQAQLHGTQTAIDDVGGRLDQVYAGVKVPASAVTDRMLGLAIELEKNPATSRMADQIMSEASEVNRSWGTGDVDARAVRKYATSLGKSLFNGNPNTDPSLAKQIRNQVYGTLVDAVGQHVEAAKPGTAETLGQLNSDMSDLLNMQSAVTSKASREASPSTRLSNVAASVADKVIGFTHPAHYVAKKAIEHFGPGVVRGVDSVLADSAAPSSLIQSANPIMQALDNWKNENSRRAEQIKGAARAAENAKRTMDAATQRANDVRMMDLFQRNQNEDN